MTIYYLRNIFSARITYFQGFPKQILKAINLRMGKLSANEKIFKESSKRYIDALKNSGFKEDFRYLKENITNEITKENNNYNQKNKNRKRKIIWFNPPFCKLANIDVGKYFWRLIDKHFKQDNILHKIFNWKTLKISYSFTKNISQIIYLLLHLYVRLLIKV